MLLIEKVVKLLDDFHFDIFREHVKNLSLRSYYPMVLVDVIDRSYNKEQTSERLFELVYGDPPDGEKDMKKFFQLAHYTFKLTGFLARNYPDYLQHNLTRIQHLINTGKLESANLLASILQDVSAKIEDLDTEMKLLRFLAQREGYLESNKEAMDFYERIGEILSFQKDLNDINFFVYRQLKDKGKENTVTVAEMRRFFQPYLENKSMAVQLVARLNVCHQLYLYRDDSFYEKAVFDELEAISDALEKFDYIVFPYLHNLRPKLSFLRLNYSIRQLSSELVLKEATDLIEQSEDELFWNSFVNLPEINSIAVQTSHLVTDYFTSYRDDHLELLPDDIKDRIRFLKNKCQSLLKNQLLQDRYVVKYINLTTLYAGLLLLGEKKDIEAAYTSLEDLLLFYQQIPFHAYIDPIYTFMIMAGFCLKDYEKVERCYRRYKKSTTGKVVNPENDLTLQGFYFASKWMDTQRDQYAKKLSAVIEQTEDKTNLKSTGLLLLGVAEHFKIPIGVALLKKR